tara:strand:- start:368 stop:859 length:492 start_codon:yes stop_codon:yes gene_type:complete
MSELWNIEKNESGIFVWKKNDSFDLSSCEKLTIKTDFIEQTETYLLKDWDNDELLVAKNNYFDGGGSITIPIEKEFDISFIENNEHQFSIYDLNGEYSFNDGWSDMNMSYDDIAECINEEEFENKKKELEEEDNQIIIDEILSDYGSDSDVCILKGEVNLESI